MSVFDKPKSVMIKCKMWFYTNQRASCKLLLLLCFRASPHTSISVPSVILQVFLHEGSSKRCMMCVRLLSYSSAGLCQSKIPYAD